MKDIDLINNTVVKHEIFNIFDNTRELYNMYYVLHTGNYTEEDYNNMYNEQYNEEYNEEIPMYDDPELNNSNQQQISQEEPIYDEQIFDQNQESEEFTDEV